MAASARQATFYSARGGTKRRIAVVLCVTALASVVPVSAANAAPGTHRFVGEGAFLYCALGLPAVGCWVPVIAVAPAHVDATDANGGSGRVIVGGLVNHPQWIIELDCVVTFSTPLGYEAMAASGTTGEGTRHYLQIAEGRVDSSGIQGGVLNGAEQGNGPCGVRIHPEQRRLEFHGVLRTEEPDAANSYPVAEFSYWCKRRACTFDASPSRDEGQIVRYQWDFYTGVSEGQHASFVFPQWQSYNGPNQVYVTLTVTDDRGAVAVTHGYVQLGKGRAPTTGTSTRDF